MLSQCDQRRHDWKDTEFALGATADEMDSERGQVVARRGSDIDVEAYILQAALEKKPSLKSKDSAAKYVNDLPKASAEFAAVEERARELVWGDGELKNSWLHIVHARIYDMRVTARLQGVNSTDKCRVMPGSALWEMPAEWVRVRTQVNELTQDRDGTTKLAVWEMLEEMETKGAEICNRSTCHPVVRLEAQHDTQREVNCTTGDDLYERMRVDDDGEAYAQYGSTLTYVTLRLLPVEAELDGDKAYKSAAPSRQLQRALAAPGVIKSRTLFEKVKYGDRCFSVPPILLSAFLDGSGTATWPM